MKVTLDTDILVYGEDNRDEGKTEEAERHPHPVAAFTFGS